MRARTMRARAVRAHPLPRVPVAPRRVRPSPTAVWAIVPQGGTGGHTGRRPSRRLRVPRPDPHHQDAATRV
ncbi:hypothetical protein, partial [Streptomyces sp. NPDC056549]|uniref:hypothetical protein n=1 Tax=Streptomyces sp. NPDC056549 TaxID=3345864 RepID=UPI0036C1E57C